MLANFCLENFCQCKFLSTECPLRIYLAPDLLLDVCCVSLWFIYISPLATGFYSPFQEFYYTSRMKHIVLSVSLSVRQCCYLSALLNLTDEMLIRCFLFSFTHISPVRSWNSFETHFKYGSAYPDLNGL